MKKTRLACGLVLLLLVAGTTTFGLLMMGHWGESRKVENNNRVKVVASSISSVGAKYLFAGTTFWGRGTNIVARRSELGVKYPFSGLDTLHREKYQAWIAGLECPVTEKNGIHNTYEEETIFKFNCDPDYLIEAKKYFNVFLLGNNHTDNQGAEGFAETKKHLDEAGIQYYGSYDYQDGTNNCGVVVLPIVATLSDGAKRELQMPFGFCSAHGVYGIPRAALNGIEHFAKTLPTIAMPHMGQEYQPKHDDIRQALYRQMIDSGAEMVIADHPHWVQDSEAYKNKLIVYSMGNFMFDQIFNREVVRSAAIEVMLEVTNLTEVDLKAWDKIGRECLRNKSNCLEKISVAKLKRPEYKYRFDFIGTTSAGSRVTRKADTAEQAAIGERLNWTETMQGLGQ